MRQWCHGNNAYIVVCMFSFGWCCVGATQCYGIPRRRRRIEHKLTIVRQTAKYVVIEIHTPDGLGLNLLIPRPSGNPSGWTQIVCNGLWYAQARLGSVLSVFGVRTYLLHSQL
jgi:hypothetical protein